MTGVVMATLLEADPFVAGLGLRLQEERPFALYGGRDLALVISGIGKANAAMAVARLVWTCGVTTVFNLGAAGSTGDGASLGEIFQVTRVIEHDRPRLLSGKTRVLIPDILEGHSTTTLATQDVAVTQPEKRAALAPMASLVDMEGRCRGAGL
jgi:nucleoside phosphorylase